MAYKSAIEWCESTWNPVRGTSARHRCVKISPGCDFCYASAYNARYCGGRDFPDASLVNLGPSRHGIPLLVTNGGYLDGRDIEIDTLRLDEEILLEPVRWQKPRMVFVCSMTDVAGEWVPDEWLDKLWAVMALASQHTYQVLTKRPKRLYEWLSDPKTPDRVSAQMAKIAAARGYCKDEIGECPTCKGHGVPTAICPAGALGDCDSEHDFDEWCDVCEGKGWVVDWLIVGGESRGPVARRLIEKCDTNKLRSFTHSHCGHLLAPIGDGVAEDTGLVVKLESLDWIRDLRDRAVAARTNFFFKQWGGARPKAGGRTLDGRTWDETPTVRRQTG